jgi:flagellum-specific peptidoglycan hydrolase FlgJ
MIKILHPLLLYICGLTVLKPANVETTLILKEVQFSKIVLAQSILETGWYKCKDCSLQSNNIFGFRVKSGYLSFAHWTESVKYYKKWQDARFKKYKKEICNDEDYYNFLKAVGYAEDPEYENKLKLIVKRL